MIDKKKGGQRGDQMSAIKYAEMKRNRSLGDFFITDNNNSDDKNDDEYSDYIG